MIPPIVTRSWLADRPAAVVVDVRGYLDGRDPATEYQAAHLPDARLVTLDELCGPVDDPTAGRHPMPTAEQFAETLGRAGISPTDQVVAYDDQGGMMAGRLVWMLRVLERDAALLDVGPQPWEGAVSGAAPSTRPVDVAPEPWPAGTFVGADEVTAAVQAGGLVVDSRGAERYRGDVEPIDPRAGHIPGAINLPFAENLADGQFRRATELAERFAAIDADTIFYCGSGVSACHNLLAAEAAGRPRARLYVASWSGWSSDPNRPSQSSEQGPTDR